ncbi:MAG: galactose-1-epimerase [Acidobacteria bacterium]|nr:MAG: galactose mutarotase [Acidobacteria bacterium 13_1_40CM_4_58_4]PYT64060.1 MAG: galactose-1-epimerase [Acidobacteriota bacterium]
MKRLPLWITITGAILMTMMTANGAATKSGSITKSSFGKTPDGEPVDLYLLKNKNGVEVAITTYGGAVVSLKVSDRNGKLGDVVLGYDSLEGYENDKAYLGAIVGRYANRIAHAQFILDGKTYTLAKNNGENSLHGGIKGFNKKVWTAKAIPGKYDQSLELSYLSKDGEEGFPGNLKVTVTYMLMDSNKLRIEYSATTDKKTVVNLTNHSYFNLAGPGSGDILGHILQIEADKFTPVDSNLIPTGELRDVAGTPFDFRKPTAIGGRIDSDDEQIKLGGGYDHNFVLRSWEKPSGGTPVARVVERKSGRVLEVWTTLPGMQLYTGNFLDGTTKGKGGIAYTRRSAFCLETQYYPNSPNQPKFPSPVLRPGEHYHAMTLYKFSVEKQ